MHGRLPAKFTEKMKKLLGGDYDGFMASYDASRVYGLRVNRLKLDAGEWKRLSPVGDSVRPIPWSEDGFYYNEEDRPGKHPHYDAGLYYVQEPSAMAPVELLDVRPGHKVLDLCAAPGGKSTQIAAKLGGSGVLVSNDNAKERTKALAKNIERAGVRNAVILNEEPEALTSVFSEWFDRILVDAPCSGEGMFRKDESMIADWEKHSVEHCAAMQRGILRNAASMLAPGGLLVYSTCTFSPEEDEWQIAELLAERGDMEVVRVSHEHGWSEGMTEQAALAPAAESLSRERLNSIAGTVRLWPHRIEGEGHYAAVLKRRDMDSSYAVVAAEPIHLAAGQADERRSNRYGDKLLQAEYGAGGRPGGRKGKETDIRKGRVKPSAVPAGRGREREPAGKQAVRQEADPVALWLEYAEQFIVGVRHWPGVPIAYGSRVYLQPEGIPPLDGLKVVRAGWYVGEAGRGKFEPSQPLAMGLARAEAVRSVSFGPDDTRTIKYLRGETLFADEDDIVVREGEPLGGYLLVCTDGYPVGWAKYAGGMLKNELPAGWRRI